MFSHSLTRVFIAAWFLIFLSGSILQPDGWLIADCGSEMTENIRVAGNENNETDQVPLFQIAHFPVKSLNVCFLFTDSSKIIPLTPFLAVLIPPPES